MVSILALSFHPAFYPPKSGGEQRLYYIYHYLSNFYDITLISFTYPNPQNKIEVVEHNKHFREIRIPKTKLSLLLHHLVEKFSNIKECSAIITSIESRFNKNFKKVIKEDLRDADAVVFVSPYLFTVPTGILKSKKIVYESYNIEYELMKQSLSDSIIGKSLLRYVYHIEKSLSRRSRLIFAVSEEDRYKLSQTYKINKNKIYISPSGVNLNEYDNVIRENRRESSKKPLLYLFIGSYHPPNIEAIENITKFASELPECYFIVAGSSAQYFISYASNLLEQSDFEKIYHVFDLNKKISLVSGFYNPEFWDSIPTVWCKPHFKIYVSEGIESMDLKIYSPYNQKFEVELDDRSICFELEESWNSVKISNANKQEHLIPFTCEKTLDDQKRKLGIAIQEITYYMDNKKFNVDLTQSSHQLFALKESRNVLLLGQISNEEKLELYHISDVALNPMLSGSGTNIKMLDYMAAGLPVITTPVGARGLDIENYNNAIICDVSEFPKKIRELTNDKDLYDRLSRNGRKLVVEKYDWENITKRMAKILEGKLEW